MSAEAPGEKTVDLPVREWNHSRKGRIRGVVVFTHDDWYQIQLVGDHNLKYVSASLRGQTDLDGEVITVRRSFLREVTAP